jgi:AraC-like DNA-binding protein
MPLFMDYHKGLSGSVEDVKKAHMADEAVQSKYGVIYHQFWINEQDGTVFCLMEGPDKESCAAVHREAHGGVACSIVEVSTGIYKLLMGDGHLVEQGHVRHGDGTPDPGTRNILVVDIQSAAKVNGHSEHRLLKRGHPRELALSFLTRFNGRQLDWHEDDALLAVFDSPLQAITCAVKLQEELLRRENEEDSDDWSICFKMGLSAGQPITEAGDLFSDAIRLGRRLCSVANPSELLIAPLVHQKCQPGDLIANKKHVRTLSVREQDFISSLFAISEEKLADEFFTIDSLSKNIGMSRPQLYRKTVSLTGKSPNDFIRDLRMDKALTLLRKKAGNISEIALEVGYSNPSYFARCFQMRYGCTPSRYVLQDTGEYSR